VPRYFFFKFKTMHYYRTILFVFTRISTSTAFTVTHNSSAQAQSLLLLTIVLRWLQVQGTLESLATQL